MMAMLPIRRRQGLHRSLGIVGLAVFAAAGCRDAASDPLAVLVAGETHGALALRTELPALPDLAVRAGAEGRLADALELWESSWDGPAEEARELRAEAYRRAAPEVADALGRESARGLLADMGMALRAVGTLDRGAMEPDLEAGVARARRLHGSAEEALARGDLPGAFALEMEASDALRAIAPPVVAHSLLAGAEDALANGDGGSLSDADRNRARRLVEGSRRALEAEDWSRAIRRAFYASQLLGLPAR